MTAFIPTERLIKSQERVRAHGEVFTPSNLVNQMLDQVKPELESGPNFIDTTFFEPAAGSGNFLTVILRRKLRALQQRYKPTVWPAESLFALASIYGVELLEDNHKAAKAALLSVFVDFHNLAGNSCSPKTDLYRSALKIVDCNIVHGNTLSGQFDKGGEIILSWWNRTPKESTNVKREPFSLSALRNNSKYEGMIDFTIYESYEICPINHVYKEIKTNE